MPKLLAHVGCAQEDERGDAADDQRPVDCGVHVRRVPHVADRRLEK